MENILISRNDASKTLQTAMRFQGGPAVARHSWGWSIHSSGLIFPVGGSQNEMDDHNPIDPGVIIVINLCLFCDIPTTYHINDTC